MKKILTTIILFLFWGNISFASVEEVLQEIKKNKDIVQGFNKVYEYEKIFNNYYFIFSLEQ